MLYEIKNINTGETSSVVWSDLFDNVWRDLVRDNVTDGDTVKIINDYGDSKTYTK